MNEACFKYRTSDSKGVLMIRNNIISLLIGASVFFVPACGGNLTTTGLKPSLNATENHDAKLPVNPDQFVQSAKTGNMQEVKAALDAGTNPNGMDKSGNTALIEASRAGHSQIVRLLVLHHADIHQGDRTFNAEPLIWAAISGQAEMVKLLMEYGADPKAREAKNGLTAYLAAAVKGHIPILSYFIENETPVDSADHDGRTALMWAANTGQTETVKLLLEKGADIGATEKERGMTALMTAAMMGQTDTVKLLLDSGADLEKTDVHGRNALMLAALYGQVDTVEMILAKGGNLRVQDAQGNTAYALAEKSRFIDTSTRKKLEALLTVEIPPAETMD